MTLGAFLDLLGQTTCDQAQTTCELDPSPLPYVFDRGTFFQQHPELLSRVADDTWVPDEAWAEQEQAAYVEDLRLGAGQLRALNHYLLVGGSGSGVGFHRHTDSMLKVFGGEKV